MKEIACDKPEPLYARISLEVSRGRESGGKAYRMIAARTGHLIDPHEQSQDVPDTLTVFNLRDMHERGAERAQQGVNRSRSRLAYLNIGLAIVLVLACVLQICIMLLDD